MKKLMKIHFDYPILTTLAIICIFSILLWITHGNIYIQIIESSLVLVGCIYGMVHSPKTSIGNEEIEGITERVRENAFREYLAFCKFHDTFSYVYDTATQTFIISTKKVNAWKSNLSYLETLLCECEHTQVQITFQEINETILSI